MGISDITKQTFETLEQEPQEMGIEGINQAQNNYKQQKQAQDDVQKYGKKILTNNQRQQFINDLYGTSLTGEPEDRMDDLDQLKAMDDITLQKTKEQRNKILRQNYEEIQNKIQEYRVKKQQEISKQEVGQQEGTEVARDQEEKQELWEKEQKKAEEKKKKEEAARLPGSQQSRSAEQQKVMG
ncbi:hypothetical protein GYA19_04930 [Candidatus Beckwithbacteria bacterium]|nr:hypothetical protein [Candidatus Beckwithbacteria bacterium]